MNGAPHMVASEYRRHQSGTLCAFFNLALPSGMVLHGCSLHQQNGKRWIGLPGKPLLGPDGKQRLTPKTGKGAWSAVVEIPDSSIRGRFQAEALAAVDRLLSKGRAP